MGSKKAEIVKNKRETKAEKKQKDKKDTNIKSVSKGKENICLSC